MLPRTFKNCPIWSHCVFSERDGVRITIVCPSTSPAPVCLDATCERKTKNIFLQEKKTFLRPPQPTLNESILTGLNLKTVGLDLRLNWVELNRLYVIVCYFWWGSSHRSVDPFATINLPPWVESQPHHLCFFNFYIRNWCYIGYWIVKRTKLNWKEAGIGLFFKKLLLLLQTNKN